MSTPTTSDRQRPVFVIPPSPRLKNRRKPLYYSGPHLFTLFLVVIGLAAFFHLLLSLHTSAPGAATSQNSPIDCSSLLRSNDYTKSVNLQAGDQLGAIAPANQLDGGTPAELVQVQHSDPQHTIDVYLFGCAIHQNRPVLTTLFVKRGLVNGTVEISPSHTLITGTLDTSLSPDASALLLPSQQYIYREYAWLHEALQQIIFPGFYPVTSRAEAEALQQMADSGQSLPWSDPLATAAAMAKDILQWPAAGQQATLLSNDGTTAQINLLQRNPPLTVNVTLEKLVQQDNKGLWFVVAAHTQGLTAGLYGMDMTALPQQNPAPFPQPQTPIPSPLTLQGTGALADGQTSTTLFDHTLSPISSASNVPIQVKSDGTYSGSLSYTTSVPGQQGVLLIQSLPLAANDAVEQGQELVVPILLG